MKKKKNAKFKGDNSAKDGGGTDKQTAPWVMSNPCMKFQGPRLNSFWDGARQWKIAKFK